MGGVCWRPEVTKGCGFGHGGHSLTWVDRTLHDSGYTAASSLSTMAAVAQGTKHDARLPE